MGNMTRVLNRSEVEGLRQRYNVFVAHWNDAEADHSQPLPTVSHGAMTFDMVRHRRNRPLDILISTDGWTATLTAPPKWDTWATSGLKGPWMRRELPDGAEIRGTVNMNPAPWRH